MSLLLGPSLSYLPVLGLISTCPLGQTSAKGKTTQGVCTMLGHRLALRLTRLFCLALLQASTWSWGAWLFPHSHTGPSFAHPVVFPSCGCEATHVHGCSWGGAGQIHRPQQLAFLHCEPVNAQNFCSTPRGPPIKMILHSLPANRTSKQARKSGRLSIIMNSKWKGVVRDCFSWKVHFFPLVKIHTGKHWRLPGVFIFKSVLPWARPTRSLKQTEILANLKALLRIGFWSAQDLYPIF